MTEEDVVTPEKDLETENSDQVDAPDEAELLERARLEADALGIHYHPNIGLHKLQERLEQHRAERSPVAPAADDDDEPAKKPKKLSRGEMRAEALSLVRVRVTCMDPSKKEYEGDIFSAGNSVVGSVKKYVPFGVDWHIPRILLNTLKDKKYQAFYMVSTPNGGKIKKTRLVNTYAIEELPALTDKELRELKQRQLMAQGQ